MTAEPSTNRPSRSRRATIIGTTAALIAGGGFAVAAAATVSSSGHAKTIDYSALPTSRLAGDVLPGLHKAKAGSVTKASTKLLVGVMLNNSHAAAINTLESEIYTKGSAEYHHFLTPAAFAAKFATSASEYNEVRGWATRDGLTVARTTSTHTYLTLSGTAAQAEKTFAVTLRNYTDAGRHFYANTAVPAVPTGLGVSGVIGLDNANKGSLPKGGATNEKMVEISGGKTAAVVHPDQGTCASTLCTGLTTPQDIWSAYDAPTNNYGQGQQMAILGEGATDTVISDLRTFESLNALPQIPIDVIHTDGASADYTDASGQDEWDLDTQSSTGMSPEALDEKLYFGSSLSEASLLDDTEAWVEDADGPLQASESIGECEYNATSNATGGDTGATQSFTDENEAALEQAVIEGRTLFVSTGDTGSSCPILPLPVNVNGVANEGVPLVNYPASSPNAVAVGGTVLYTDGGSGSTGLTPSGATRQLETSWDETGGGTSVTFPQPAYQTNYESPTPTIDCLDDDQGNTPPAVEGPCRGIPDIAAQSGDIATNGYATVVSGAASTGAGTSLSSPMSMGLWTRINAAAPECTTGSYAGTYCGLGFANDIYYPDDAKNPGDFFDIGGETNGSPTTTDGYYDSLPGDDYTSGLGVPNYAMVSMSVNGTTAPANDILPTYPVSTGGSTGSNIDPCAATLFTDPAGDDDYPDGLETGNNPQLDILSGNISVANGNLTTTMTINDLSTDSADPVGAANEYYFLFTYGGMQYFTVAQVDTTTGDITYDDGSVVNNEFTDNASTDVTGSFNLGMNGTVVVTAPLKEVGSATTGDTLLAPTAETRVLVGTAETGGEVEEADTGGPGYDFDIGATCTGMSTGTATPTPTATSSSPIAVVSPTVIGSVTSSPTGSVTPTESTSPSTSTNPTTSPTSPPPTTGSAPPTTGSAPPTTGSAPPTMSTSPSSSPTKKPTTKYVPDYNTHYHPAKNGHKKYLIFKIRDPKGPGINKLLQVHITNCTWSLGKETSKHFSKLKHTFQIRVTIKNTKKKARVSFVMYDKSGGHRRVHSDRA